MLAYIKLGAIFLWLAVMGCIAQILHWLGAQKGKDRIYVICFRGMAWLMGLRIKLEGRLVKDRPLLLVTNHCSYLDIIILATIAPLRFTPKKEISGWPFIGWLCRLSESVFIDRNPRKSKENLDALKESLERGNVVCLFPEGTTNDGKRVYPFHSSYFKLVDLDFADAPLSIQPAAISYTHMHNLPIDTTQRSMIAWVGDMELLPHFLDVLRMGTVTAHIVFRAKVDTQEVSDRKTIAGQCEAMVREAIKY